ncbi:unnamed protein product [Staurois parvus]|uniref:Uncharacterized protein n=1 Tax=Staurois parvus TaxID=386267 RepID=A0ABN9H6U3_9NEOB|nr:unnamed protein product [Staurois parvus]
MPREVRLTVYFAKRGHLGDICTVLTFLDLKKLDWPSVLQNLSIFRSIP